MPENSLILPVLPFDAKLAEFTKMDPLISTEEARKCLCGKLDEYLIQIIKIPCILNSHRLRKMLELNKFYKTEDDEIMDVLNFSVKGKFTPSFIKSP